MPQKLFEGFSKGLVEETQFSQLQQEYKAETEQLQQALLGGGMHHGKSDHPLAGKIKCGVCGHAMPLHKTKNLYFSCGTRWYDSDYACGDFRVGQDELFEVLKQALQQQIVWRVEQETLRRIESEKLAKRRTTLEGELSALECGLARGKEQMRVQFEQFAAGTLSEADFVRLQRSNKRQTAQQSEKIIEVQLHMAKSGENGKICPPFL